MALKKSTAKKAAPAKTATRRPRSAAKPSAAEPAGRGTPHTWSIGNTIRFRNRHQCPGGRTVTDKQNESCGRCPSADVCTDGRFNPKA